MVNHDKMWSKGLDGIISSLERYPAYDVLVVFRRPLVETMIQSDCLMRFVRSGLRLEFLENPTVGDMQEASCRVHFEAVKLRRMRGGGRLKVSRTRCNYLGPRTFLLIRHIQKRSL